MKNFLPVILFVLLFYNEANCQQKLQINTTAMEDNLDSLMLPLVKDKLISGTILIAINDNILLHEAYGMANIEKGIPNTTDTKFPIASITKMFTAVSILQLYERGKLDLQDKLNKLIPDFPQGDKITITNLLNHTSGIPSYNSVEERNTNFEELISIIKELPLKFQPGKDNDYSNSGFTLLAYIIEKVSGMPYEDFVAENIFKPSKMNNSGILPADSNIMIDNLAQGYTFDTGRIQPANTRRPHGKGEGSLYSTTTDLYKFNKALFNNKLISKKTLDLMTTPLNQKYNQYYGMGCIIENNNGWKVVWHNGGVVGFRTRFNVLRKPDVKVTIIDLFNTDFLLSDLVDAQIRKIALGEPWKPIFFIDKKLVNAFRKFASSYEMSGDDAFAITIENGEFYYQENNQPKHKALPYSATSLFIKDINARIHFAENEKNGNITFRGYYSTPESAYMVTGTKK